MRKCWRKLWADPAILALHLSFLLILAGALCTCFFRQKGVLRLSPGERQTAFRSADRKNLPLPVVMELDSFRVEYYPGGTFPRDYISYLKVGGEPRVISMNRIMTTDGYRFCQAGYDYDGSTFLSVNHDTAGIALVYTGFAVFAISGLITLLSRRKGRLLRTIATILATALGFVTYPIISSPDGTPLQPVLNSPWLPVHVSLAMASYFLFLLTCVMAVTALIKPSHAAKLRSLSLSLLSPAEWLLGLGIITGSVWANISWGSYWSWDPKENLALITFLIYAFPLHPGIPYFRSPRHFHIYMFIAILTVAATYFGVNLLPSLHAYN